MGDKDYESTSYCTYQDQIHLAQTYNIPMLVLVPDPTSQSHLLASDILVSLWGNMSNPNHHEYDYHHHHGGGGNSSNRSSSRIRWKSKIVKQQIQQYSHANDDDNNNNGDNMDKDTTGILIVSAQDMKWLYSKMHSNPSSNTFYNPYKQSFSSSLSSVVTVVMKPDPQIDRSWSRLQELSQPWHWPSDAKQRKRLFRKMRKTNQSSKIRTNALWKFYHQAQDYYFHKECHVP